MFQNSFEGGSNGVTITTLNTGGASGDAFAVVSPGSATITFDNAHPAHGGMAGLFSAGSGGPYVAFQWTSNADSYGRAYLYLSPLPNTKNALIRGFLAGSGTWGIALNGGALELNDAATATVGTFATTILVDTLYRLEWHCNSVSQLVVRLYLGNSGTVTETVTASSGTNSNTSEVRYRNQSSNGAVWYDDVVGNAADWPGPFGVTDSATGSDVSSLKRTVTDTSAGVDIASAHSSPPTIAQFTGFEHKNIGGFGINNVNGASNFSVDTAGGHYGPAAKLVQTTTPSTGYIEMTVASNQKRAVAFAAFKISAFPTAGTAALIVITGPTAATVPRIEITTAGALQASFGGNNPQSFGTLSLNTWYTVEYRFDMRTTAFTIDWWVNGIAQTQATTTGVATNIGVFRFGQNNTSAQINALWLDDIGYSLTYSDAPIGRLKVNGYAPTHTGVHNLAAGAFTKTGSVAITSGDNSQTPGTAAELDEIPFSNTDWVAQTAPDTTAYLEYGFAGTGETNPPYAVAAHAQFQGSATGTYTAEQRLWDGTTESTDISAGKTKSGTTSIRTSKVFTATPTGTAWTTGLFAGSTLRVGYSSDTTPNFQCNWIFLEAIFLPVFLQTDSGTASDVSNLTRTVTDSGTATDASGATLLTRTDSGTSADVATVAIGNNLSRTDTGFGTNVSTEVFRANRADSGTGGTSSSALGVRLSQVDNSSSDLVPSNSLLPSNTLLLHSRTTDISFSLRRRTDSATSTDSGLRRLSFSRTDTGTATESRIQAVHMSVFDEPEIVPSLTLTPALNLLVGVPSVDASILQFLASRTESAIGSNVSTEAARYTVTQTNASSPQTTSLNTSGGTQLHRSDAGTSTDTANRQPTQRPQSDAGAGANVATINTAGGTQKLGSDSGTATQTALRSPQFRTGTDTTTSVNESSLTTDSGVQVNRVDSALGSETSHREPTIVNRTDTASGTNVSDLNTAGGIQVGAVDSAAGSESGFRSPQSRAGIDSGLGSEEITLAQQGLILVTSDDEALGEETSDILRGVFDLDTIIGVAVIGSEDLREGTDTQIAIGRAVISSRDRYKVRTRAAIVWKVVA